MHTVGKFGILSRHLLYESLVLLLLFVLPHECFKWENSVYPGTVFANSSQKALFRWKYTLGNAKLNNLQISCGYIPVGKASQQQVFVKLVEKVGHNSRMTGAGSLPGRVKTRVEAYQENVRRTGKVDKSVVGFRIMQAVLTHPVYYICYAVYESTGGVLGSGYSKREKLVVYDPPELIDCLQNLPPVREGKDLEFSCYAGGNPAPTLQCQLLSYDGTLMKKYKYPEQPKPLNISLQTFKKVPREAEEIMCLAYGGPVTGTVNKTVLLEVHHTPSEPYIVKFIPAVNTSSVNIMWSEIRDNETGGEIISYLIEYYKTEALRVSRKTIELKIRLLEQHKIVDEWDETYYTYQVHGLYPDDEYKFELSGKNRWGFGLKWTGTVIPAHTPVINSGASSASVGAIIGGIIAGIVFIVIFVVLAVWCSTHSKKGEKLPTSHVEDAVDYPQGVGQSLYANIDKNKNKTSRTGSTREYPDVVNGTSDMRPMVSSNSYEPSNKSFV